MAALRPLDPVVGVLNMAFGRAVMQPTAAEHRTTPTARSIVRHDLLSGVGSPAWAAVFATTFTAYLCEWHNNDRPLDDSIQGLVAGAGVEPAIFCL